MTRSTFITLTLMAFLLAACGASATPTATLPPASVPTFTLVPTIEQAPTDTPATSSISFANDVMPILQSRCVNCHGGDQTKEGLSVASYQALMAGSNNGPVIVPGDADNSLMIQKILQGKMPKRGPKLTPDQTQILIDWIMAGASNN